jgi:hypothetical protein
MSPVALQVETIPPDEKDRIVSAPCSIPELDLGCGATAEAIDDCGLTSAQIAEVEAALATLDLGEDDFAIDELDAGTGSAAPPEPVKPDALPEPVKPDAHVKPDTPVKPDAAEIAAAKAAHDAALESVRRIKAEIQELTIRKKAAQIEAEITRERVRSLERSAIMNASEGLSLLDLMRLSRERCSPPKADPDVKKANKVGRDKRYLAKVAADPDRAEDRRRMRREAQQIRRRRKSGRRDDSV